MVLGFDSRVGLAGLAVGVIGIAITLLWPDKKWLGWIFLIAGFGILLYWGIFETRQLMPNTPRLSLALSVLLGCGLGGFGAFLIWQSAAVTSPTPEHTNAAPAIDAGELARQLAERLKDRTNPPVPRAHLHVTKFEWNIPDNEGGRASVKVIFVNDGNAPTTKVVQASAMAYFTPLGNLIAQREFEDHFLSQQPIDIKDKLESSDNQIPVGVDRSFTTESSPWMKSAIDTFLQGNAAVYVAGAIFYGDAHATHETTYCGFVGKDGKMKFCGRHNQEQ